jgi:tetratricopeptide (TPR) repeat protein
MLWIILSSVLRNPILAGAAVIVIMFVTDRVAIGVLPDPFRFIKRWSRTSRLQRTLLQNKNDRRARYELAEIYVSRKKFQLAVDTLKPSLEAGDDDKHTLYLMGVACLGAGHFQQGETFLDAAEALEPGFRMGDIDLERGRYRIVRKDFKGAVEALRRFKEKRQSSIEGQYLLAKALELSGDDATAALEREAAWSHYVAAPGFQRKRERRWAWSAKPSRPLLYGTLLAIALFGFFRFVSPMIAGEARDARGAYDHAQMDDTYGP